MSNDNEMEALETTDTTKVSKNNTKLQKEGTEKDVGAENVEKMTQLEVQGRNASQGKWNLNTIKK